MSWDIVVFSSRQKIHSVEEIDDEMFVPVDFSAVLDTHFDKIKKDESHREILGQDFRIEYYAEPGAVSNQMFSLSGESALFELIRISKLYGWQIFDTGSGEMIDTEHPEKNGYNDFQNYLQHVFKSSNNDNFR
jgi:hypothetical protein